MQKPRSNGLRHIIYKRAEFGANPPPPVGPPQARISTKKHRGFGMAVEKREHRIVVYLTDSERRAVTWAAARARRRPSDAVRLAALDWADAQLEGAEREAAPG